MVNVQKYAKLVNTMIRGHLHVKNVHPVAHYVHNGDATLASKVTIYMQIPVRRIVLKVLIR
jgi:hypothetical protein